MLGTLEQHVLLAVMRKRGTAYGVSIAEELLARTGKRHSLGAIYTTLERLREKAFVVSREGEATPERGGRAKLYFELTASGEAVLGDSINAISNLQKGLKLSGAAHGHTA